MTLAERVRFQAYEFNKYDAEDLCPICGCTVDLWTCHHQKMWRAFIADVLELIGEEQDDVERPLEMALPQ